MVNKNISFYSIQIRRMNVDGNLLGLFVIIDLCALKFYKEHLIDIRKDKISMCRLESAAWVGVREFCFQDKIRINLPYIALIESNGEKSHLHLDIELNYSEYENFYKEIGGELFPKIFRKFDKSL